MSSIQFLVLANVYVEDGQQALWGEDLGVVAVGLLGKGVHDRVVGSLRAGLVPLEAGFEAPDWPLNVVEQVHGCFVV